MVIIYFDYIKQVLRYLFIRMFRFYEREYSNQFTHWKGITNVLFLYDW